MRTADFLYLLNFKPERWPAGDPAPEKALEPSAIKEQGDPRVVGNGDIFESYPRFGAMRDFPGFKERGKYNTEFLNGHEMINQDK